MYENMKRNLYILCFAAPFLSIFGMAMLFPIFPVLQRIFSVSEGAISLIPNAGFAAIILFSTLIGLLIKKVASKQVFIMCIVVWILGLLLEVVAMYTKTFPVFIIGRFIQGMGESGFFPILLYMNAVMLNHNDQPRASALLEIGASCGGITGSLFMGLLYKYPENTFTLLCIAGVIIALFVAVYIRTPKRDEPNNKTQESSNTRNLTYVGMLVLSFFIYITFGGIQTYIAYYLGSYAVHEKWNGPIVSLSQVALVLGTLTAAMFLIKKLSFKNIRLIFYFIILVALIVLAYHGPLMGSITAMMLAFFGIGMMLASMNTYISRCIFHNVSLKVSLYMVSRYGGALVSSVILGTLFKELGLSGYDYSGIFRILYVGLTVFGVLAIAVISILIKDRDFE